MPEYINDKQLHFEKVKFKYMGKDNDNYNANIYKSFIIFIIYVKSLNNGD